MQFGKIYVEVCTNTFYNLDKSTCVLDKYSLDKYIHCIIWPNILSMGISYQREVDAAPLREGIMTTGPGASLPPKGKQKYAQIFNLSLNILFVFSMKSLCEIWSFKMHNLSNAFAHSRNTNKYYFSHKEILITFQGPKINKICTLVPTVFKKRKAESLNCSIAI